MPELRSPLRLLAAGIVVGCLPALSGVASAAAATSTPAAGTAVSVLHLASLSAGSVSAQVGDLSLTTSTDGARKAVIDLVPAESSAGGKVGEVTVTPADSPKSAGGQTVQVAGGPLALGSLTAPSLTASAEDSASQLLATVSGKGLGGKLLGLPLTVVGGALSTTSKTTATGASAGKSVTITNLALPTLSDLLKALGVDLSKLPTATLEQLASTLVSVLTNLSATAKSALTQGSSAVASAQTAYNTAVTSYDTASKALTTELTTLAASTPTLPSGTAVPTSVSGLQSLSSTDLTALETLDPSLVSLVDAYNAAATALVSALDTLTAAITDLVNQLTSALNKPLASLGDIKVATTASSGSSYVASAVANVGSVSVLDIATSLSSLTTTLQATVGKVFDVLNGVTGVSLAVPTVTVAKVSTKKFTSGAYKVASVTVTPLEVTLPAQSVNLPTTSLPGGGTTVPSTGLTIPDTGLTLPGGISIPGGVSLPGGTTLPGITDVTTTVGGVTGTLSRSHALHPRVSTPALDLSIASVVDTAQYRPAVTAPQTAPQTPTGGTSNPSLAYTGSSTLLPLGALLLLAVGLGVRRLRRHTG